MIRRAPRSAPPAGPPRPRCALGSASGSGGPCPRPPPVSVLVRAGLPVRRSAPVALCAPLPRPALSWARPPRAVLPAGRSRRVLSAPALALSSRAKRSRIAPDQRGGSRSSRSLRRACVAPAPPRRLFGGVLVSARARLLRPFAPAARSLRLSGARVARPACSLPLALPAGLRARCASLPPQWGPSGAQIGSLRSQDI